MSNHKTDQFANIAMTKAGSIRSGLETPEPINTEGIVLPLNDSHSTIEDFPVLPRMSTRDELYSELGRWKDRYKPFLQNLAPEVESNRASIPLTHFDWRIETEDDRKNFPGVLDGEGEWEQVSIPHYGGPLGEAVTYYRCEFQVDKLPEEKESAFICFDGADYLAHVFINGTLAGSHEGFFAPFEFCITPHLKPGKNVLVVKLENDFIMKGNYGWSEDEHKLVEGNKLYAATGPGYDDPEVGWHHCPPGMGIYQNVKFEIRSSVYVQDLYVRATDLHGPVEAWIEIANVHPGFEDVDLAISVYGQNFEEIIVENMKYSPSTSREVGLGDSFTEQRLRAQGVLDTPVVLFIEKGANQFKLPIEIPNPRIWEPDSPWLYQLQVRILDNSGKTLDCQVQQFGVRTFELDTNTEPKGMFRLNGRPVRLRGANTMGHEQQCIMKEDWNQLIEDLLLARICNMNFLRLTQRPVQKKVYEYCDMLGLMTQTDLPLFGVLKRDRFCEALRQVEEMERLVRAHPCNVVISYINEPFPNANNKPHRHLLRSELGVFFQTADQIVKLSNPERVIKHVDGDYDPPSESLPDNHCYTLWYNGSGIDFGLLHKGYWQPVKKGWNYGCGEFGVEGLESVDFMRKYYPKEWLPRTGESESGWSPSQIKDSQTGGFHYLFYRTPTTLEDWVKESQKWQAEGVKLMTEAFRRDSRMVTFAVHLFIDAFPSGWMKTIMDSDRNPKPAYFAYRDSLKPLIVNLRTDKIRGFSGEAMKIETWICNDGAEPKEGIELCYKTMRESSVMQSGQTEAKVPECNSKFQGHLEVQLPRVTSVEIIQIVAALRNSVGDIIDDYTLDIKVFPKSRDRIEKNVWLKSSKIARELADHFQATTVSSISESDLFIIDVNSLDEYQEHEREILEKVHSGSTLILYNLPDGDYLIANSSIRISNCAMLPVHFVAQSKLLLDTGLFAEDDFRFWYDCAIDRISPLLEATFMADGFEPILLSGNADSSGEWSRQFAVAQKHHGEGKIIVTNILLENRLSENPVAELFAEKLMTGEFFNK